jgi:hypothetical protein
MHTEVVKWGSTASLLPGVLFWKSGANYQLALNLLVCVVAAVVLFQAFHTQKYSWTTGFLAVALLCNCRVPAFSLAGAVSLSIVVLSIATFAMALIAFGMQEVNRCKFIGGIITLD